MVIPDIIVFTISGITDIIAISDLSTTTNCVGVEAEVSLFRLTIFYVATCPLECLNHLVLLTLAQVIECASGEAEETLS